VNREDAPSLPLEAVQRSGVRWDGDVAVPVTETIAAEMPVALVYNGVSHVVMLATPLDLEAFGMGFSITEGIVRDASEVYGVEAVVVPEGVEVRIDLSTQRFAELKERRRNLAGRTGCGLCGAETLKQALRDLPRLPGGLTVSPAALHRAFSELPAKQTLFARTGAVHAAGWARPDGALVLAREDVGRHNALDKMVGALVREGIDPAEGFAVITSRASSEMVQKCATAGIALLAAVSAPTDLAIRLAEGANLMLAGFARGTRHVAYSHPERIVP